MMIQRNDDTIAAISTPIGVNGIGIVRMSGKNALPILKKIFRGKNGTQFNIASHRMYLGEIIDTDKGNILDEVLITYMKAPKTYTREDVVEINCHSSVHILKEIVTLVVKKGARLAGFGEFTKRAFLNGRIDLLQAEAVMDLLNAETEEGRRIVLNQLNGGLSKHITRLREDILDILACVEYMMDFQEESGPDYTIDYNHITKQSTSLIKVLNDIISTCHEGQLFKNGITTLIIGRPNVGKSSLLNILLNERRAIVTPIPGTTRDFIDGSISIKGIQLRVVDTAGLRKCEDVIEHEGVSTTYRKMKEADIILFMIDASDRVYDEEIQTFGELKEKKRIVILNKIDLGSKISERKIHESFLTTDIVKISALHNYGIDDLRDSLYKVSIDGIDTFLGKQVITSLRHKEALENCLTHVINGCKASEDGMPPEIISLEFQSAREQLDLLLGTVSYDEILDKIFSQFCIGK